MEERGGGGRQAGRVEGWGCGVVDVKPYGPCDSLFPGLIQLFIS